MAGLKDSMDRLMDGPPSDLKAVVPQLRQRPELAAELFNALIRQRSHECVKPPHLLSRPLIH